MAEGYRMDYLLVPDAMEMTIQAMRPHWALKEFDLWGDSMVIFRGPMNVTPQECIDLKEYKRGTVFPKGDLLHFVIEHFNDNLETGILRQNILVSIAEEKLVHRIGSAQKVLRWGDDLYDEDKRLTLTAVAPTLVSVKIHFGICIDSFPESGFAGIDEYSLDPIELGEVIGNQYRADIRRLREKCWRMRPIL
ncbi:hypothetical protein DRQ33_03645 [bacterium]|nr:MAG: hypothetical protein DRQ33_03645 [bacterium]